MAYRLDPEWKKETFTKAAEELGIKPIQAYKWGYHQKLKGLECSQKKSNEVKLTSTKFDIVAYL